MNNLEEAHAHSFQNKEEIEASALCGCFQCLKIYEPTQIDDWVDDVAGQTALCAYCGIDSVIGDRSGIKITNDTLAQMNKKYFDAADSE